MSKKTLDYFLKKHEPKIVEIEAPESFVDENGKRIMMRVRILTQEEIDRIYDSYTKKATAFDGTGRKKKPLVDGGELVVRRDRDSGAALRHVVAEALVDPEIKSQVCMEFYNCYDISEILYKVFPLSEDFNYVVTEVLKALGITNDDDENEEDDFESAKN